MNTENNNQQGVILLLLLLVIGITSFIFFFAFARTNLTNLMDVDEHIKTIQAKENLFSCINEALINLHVDSSFSTTSLNMVSYNCGMNLNVIASTTVMNVSTTYENIVRNAEVTLTVDPLVIVSIEEK